MNKKTNIVNIDEIKLKKLKLQGHLPSIIEEFDILRLKFIYKKNMTKEEAQKFVLLCKYLMEEAPTESMKLNCKFIYEKYMEPYNL